MSRFIFAMENNWRKREREREFWEGSGVCRTLITPWFRYPLHPEIRRGSGFNELPVLTTSETVAPGEGSPANLISRALTRKKSRAASRSCAIVASAPRLICSNWWRLIAYKRARAARAHVEVQRRQLRFSREQKFASRARSRLRHWRSCKLHLPPRLKGWLKMTRRPARASNRTRPHILRSWSRLLIALIANLKRYDRLFSNFPNSSRFKLPKS